MRTITNSKSAIVCAWGILVSLAITGCSKDEEDHSYTIAVRSFSVNESIVGNTLNLSTELGQTTFITAVQPGDENTANFIAEPVKVEKGFHRDVRLTFEEGTISKDPMGQEVVFKLYSDNQKEGIQGEWDERDQPLKKFNNELWLKTVTVYNVFYARFDEDKDEALDLMEFEPTYPYLYYFYDGIGNPDDNLSKEEFYEAMFYNADIDKSGRLDENEFNQGAVLLYGDYIGPELSSFDQNEDGKLNKNEWVGAFKNAQWFEEFDLNNNNFVNQEEWNAGLFHQWDLDKNSKIEESEFIRYYNYAQKWPDYSW